MALVWLKKHNKVFQVLCTFIVAKPASIATEHLTDRSRDEEGTLDSCCYLTDDFK